MNDNTNWSAYENSVRHKLSLFSVCSTQTNKHTRFFLLSTHPEKLVITPSVFTHLSPPSLSPLSVFHWSFSHWTHHSAFSADKEQPQDDNHIRAHNLFMVLPHISTPFSLLHTNAHTHTHPPSLSLFSLVLCDNINAGILVVMSF